MTTAELLSKAQLVPVKKGRMSHVGWHAGYLVVKYPTATYIHGPNVDAKEKAKLLKVPFPDALLANLKKKHQWFTHKVQNAGTLQ